MAAGSHIMLSSITRRTGAANTKPNIANGCASGSDAADSELPRAEHDHQRADNHRDEIAERHQHDAQQQPSEAVHASVQSVIAMARSARRSRAESFSVALLSWPHAARMSRPRGVRTGEA